MSTKENLIHALSLFCYENGVPIMKAVDITFKVLYETDQVQVDDEEAVKYGEIGGIYAIIDEKYKQFGARRLQVVNNKTPGLFAMTKEAIEKFVGKKAGGHFSDSIWTHGVSANGQGAYFNSMPRNFVSGSGTIAQHAPGQKACMFFMDGKIIVITDKYNFIDNELSTKEETFPLVARFIQSLEEEAERFSSQ